MLVSTQVWSFTLASYNSRQPVRTKQITGSAVAARCSRDARRHGHSRARRADRRLARSPAYLAKCSDLNVHGTGCLATTHRERARGSTAGGTSTPWRRGKVATPPGVETSALRARSRSPVGSRPSHPREPHPRPHTRQSAPTDSDTTPAEARHLFLQFHHHRGALQVTSQRRRQAGTNTDERQRWQRSHQTRSSQRRTRSLRYASTSDSAEHVRRHPSDTDSVSPCIRHKHSHRRGRRRQRRSHNRRHQAPGNS